MAVGTTQDLGSQDCVRNEGIATLNCLPYYLNNTADLIFVFAGSAAVVLIMFGGIKFVTSGGDPLKVARGKKTLQYAVLGLVIIISAFLLLNVAAYVTGSDCIKSLNFANCR